MSTKLLKISAAKNRFLFATDPLLTKDPPYLKPPLNKSTEAKEQEHRLRVRPSFKDFVAIGKVSLSKRRNFIKTLLPSSDFSLLDGLVVLRKTKEGRISCDFYNKDGSKAEMCGNAACCVSLYMQWRGFPLLPFRFGQKTVQPVKGGGILLNQLKSPPKDFQLRFQRQTLCYSFVKAGVPHGVLELDPKKEPLSFKKLSALREKALFLRFKNPESKKGMNVTFFQAQRENYLKAITYERGVEDFTLSCGTGAISAAWLWQKRKKPKAIEPIFVEMPGGRLQIKLQPKPALFSPVKKGF